nr:GSTmu3bc1 protein [Diaphanosoma celebensis]
MAPVHGYWNFRGYGQPIRLLLAHAGVEYEDKRYNVKGEAPNFDVSEWRSEKYSLGLDFPNLPYYIDGGVKLSQSFAILKYLGRKHGLAPKKETEQIRVDLTEAEAMDVRSKWAVTLYSPDYDKLREEYVKNFINKCKEFSAFLGSHMYFAGETLTYVDFLMYEILDTHCLLEPKALEGLDNLTAFCDRIRSLHNVAAYIKSDKFVKWPLAGPIAKFGGK